MEGKKYPCKCNYYCDYYLLDYKKAYKHKQKYHNNDSMSLKNTSSNTSLKRTYSNEVDNLLERGVEAISSGSDRKRIITRWKSKAEGGIAAAELLEITVKKENQWKKEYIEARKNLDEKLRLFVPNEKHSEYLKFLGAFKSDDDDYDKDLNNELKFLDYAKDAIEFGN
jgi:hypothetical protein